MANAESRYSTDLAGTHAGRPTNAPAGLTYYATDTGNISMSRGDNKWAIIPCQSGGVNLSWIAGTRGKPGVNGDILSATEATRMVADPAFELLGVNAVSGSSSFNAEGGITLTTAGADGDQVILVPHLDANQSGWSQFTWGTDKEVGWSCHVQTGANITNAVIWAGLKLTNVSVTATDADQIFFRYEDDVLGGDWQAIYSVGGADSAMDTNVAVVLSTAYELAITIDSSRIARMYLDGVLKATSADSLTDATDLIPYIGVEADGAAAAKALTVYGQSISRTAG